MRSLALALAFLAALPAADICSSIRAAVQAESRKQGIPAISVAVIRATKVVCSVALGQADLEQQISNTARSRHRLASLSKPVNSVLTMQLVEEGKLALNDSVRKFIPTLPAAYDAVTIRRLLSRQSGIREYAGLEDVFSTTHYPSLLKAAIAIFLKSPLQFVPGARTGLTTDGYTLLGAAREQATGQPFRQLLESRMRHFLLDDSPALTPHRVRLYRKTTTGNWENAPPFDASNKYPGGGMLATADGYADFLIQLNGGRFLQAKSIREMWTSQSLADGTLVPFATLGWATGTRGAHRFVTHGGLQPGTTTVMHWFPELSAGSVILCNAEGPDLDALQNRILAILLGSIQRAQPRPLQFTQTDMS
ncbi:MAG: beta-lactamase family protein [Bryobacterales bacterium]|nr:beta-lactamase family protein [Bryobacterales bacterium]